MPVDLTRVDVYEKYNVPDADVETCLKVLRTLRDAYDAKGDAVSRSRAYRLTNAHALITDATTKCQEEEPSAPSNPPGAPEQDGDEDHALPDPDFRV